MKSNTGRSLPPDVNPETLSRLSPIRREALGEAQQKAYDAAMARPAGGLNLAGLKGPGGVWIRVPPLGKPMGELNRVLRSELGLDPRLVEVAILAAAREMDSRFEWAMHEPVALEKGVAPETIDAIRHRKALAGVPEKEAVLIELVRESVGAKKVGPGTYARAIAAFGEEGVINYVALFSAYVMTAAVLCVFDQQLHDGQEDRLPV
jgi:4-carboxymuconolactone decarboxylase